MSPQRAPIPDEQRRLRAARWHPARPAGEEAGPPRAQWRARADDVYVVVDDIDGEMVRLVVSVWPRLDGGGRLVFRLPPGATGAQKAWRSVLERLLPAEDRPSITTDAQPYEVLFAVRLASLQQAVNEARARIGQLGADRDIRIGDVFRVRGLGSGDVREWHDVLDVTAPARDTARAALLAAAAPKIASRADLELEEAPPAREVERPRRRPPGTVAASSV